MHNNKFWKAFAALFLLGPLVYLLVYGVAIQWIFPQLLPSLSLNNWKQLFNGSQGLGGSLGLSLLLSSVMASVSSILAFFTSRYLSYGAHSRHWQNLAYLPFALSPVVYAVSIHFYFNYLGLSASIIGVMLSQLFLLYPYSVILFSTFWSPKVKAYEQAIATIGGGRWMQWKHGVWPLAKNVFAFSWIQTFLISWFDFGMTQYIGVGKVKTLTLQVFQLVSEANPYLAAVAGGLLVLPPLLLLYINKKFLVQRAFSRV